MKLALLIFGATVSLSAMGVCAVYTGSQPDVAMSPFSMQGMTMGCCFLVTISLTFAAITEATENRPKR